MYTPDENVDDKTQDYNVDDDTSDENVNKNSHDDNTSNDNVDDGDKGDDNRHWAAATVKVRQGSFKPVGWSNFPACLVSSTIRCLEEEEGEVEVEQDFFPRYSNPWSQTEWGSKVIRWAKLHLF